MARVPGEADFSGIPSARSGRQIAREDTSALYAGAEALGQGIRQVGAAASSTATMLAERRERLNEFNAEAQFQVFANAERQRYDEAVRSIPAGGADGFARSYAASYTERANAFQDTLPDHLRPAMLPRLIDLRNGFQSVGETFELNEGIRVARETLDNTLNNTILPRITVVAALPDDDALAGLAQIIADGEAQINLSPDLSPIEKAQEIQAWRTRAQTAFNDALDPGRRDRFLGTEPITPLNTAQSQLIAAGLTPIQAAGVLGHLVAESELNPNAWNEGEEAGGIAQWRGDRLQALYAFAAARGTEWNDLNTQIAFLIHEAQSGDPGAQRAWRELQAATTIDEAVAAFAHFERPLGYDPDNPRNITTWQQRLNYGREIAGMPPRAETVALDAIPFETRNAMSADAATQAAAQAADRAAAQAAQTAALVNAAQMGARDGSFGYADLQRAVNDGVLTDYDDVHKIETAIEEYQGDVRSLGIAQANLANPEFQWLPGDNDHQGMVDRLWEASPTMQEVLANPGADQAQRQQAQASLAALVDRTGILPEGAANAIVAGLESNDPARMAAAVSLINDLGAVDHFAVGRALTQEQGTAAAVLATAVDIVGRTGNDEVFRRVAGELALIQSTPNYKPPTRDAVAEADAITEELGEAYRFLPSHQADVLAVAGHIFNSMARERGVPNDLSTNESVRLYETALQMAAGAQYVDGVQYGGTIEIHGVDTLVPTGVRADEVERAFEALTDEELEALGPPVSAATTLKVDAADVRAGILVAVGDGTYRVADEITATGTPVFFANAEGDFWTLDIRRLMEMREKAALAANIVQQGDPALAAEIANDPGAVVDRATETERAAYAGAGAAPSTIRPPGITPLPIGPSGVLRRLEPASDQPAMTGAEARAEAERRAQEGAAPPPVPAQDDVPEGHVRLLGGAIVPLADAADELKQRINDKVRLERSGGTAARAAEPKDEAAAMTQRAIAARKRMLAQRAATQARVPQSAASSPAASTAPGAPPSLPPAIRRASNVGIRSGASEVPMDASGVPQVIPPLLPRIPGQIRPGNVGSYPRPTTVQTTPVERRVLAAVVPPPAPMQTRPYSTPDSASPAIRNRDVGSMTLPELYWFLDYGNPTAEELRSMSVRIGLLQEQAQVNVIVQSAR